MIIPMFQDAWRFEKRRGGGLDKQRPGLHIGGGGFVQRELCRQDSVSQKPDRRIRSIMGKTRVTKDLRSF